MHRAIHVRDPSRIESQRDAKALAEGDALHRASLYVPVELSGRAREATELRLRAALERAGERLRARDVERDELEARLERLEGKLPPLEALEHGTRTLALFGDSAGWAWASLLGEEPELVQVSSRYALRPLLHALGREGRMRVLAVSAGDVRAFEGDARGMRPVEIEGLPRSLEDALGEQVEGGDVSFRSGGRPVPGRPGTSPVYYGSAASDEGREVDRERFHRAVAAAVNDAWGSGSLPVVLAADVHVAGELRKVLDLPGLLEQEVSASPPEESPAELHRRAWARAEEAIARRERELADDFERARNAGKALDREFDAVAEAAIAGRVRRLWVERDARVPGRVDEMRAARADAADPDEDALDGLVSLVLARGGEVHVCDEGGTPTGGAYCVQLR